MKSKIRPVEFITKNINATTNIFVHLKSFVEKQIQDILHNYQSYCLGLDALQLLKSNFYMSADNTLSTKNRVAITGEFGTGKTLLLLKLYLFMAQGFLKKDSFDVKNDIFPILIFPGDINRIKRPSLSDILKSLGLEDSLHNLNYCIFLDGIDEINNSEIIFDTFFVNKVRYFTCREININKFRITYSNFIPHKMYKWSTADIDLYILQYLEAQNIQSNIINDVIKIVHAENEIANSPLLLTLFLNSICRNEIIPQNQRYLSSIIIEDSLHSFLFSEIKKKNLSLTVEKAFRIIEAANWIFINKSNKGVVTKDDLVNNIYADYNKISKKTITTIIHLFFSFEDMPIPHLRLHMHKRISEYLLAKYIYNIISQNIHSPDIQFNIHMSFSIMDLLIELITLNPQNSELWIKDTLQKITKPYDILYGICIFLLCRIFYSNDNEKFLIGNISILDTYQKIIVYDQIIQYSKNTELKFSLEDEYYSFLNSDEDINRLNIGIRLYYVGAINNFDDFLQGNEEYTLADVDCLIDKYTKHFIENTLMNKHYILRRVELFTLNEIAKEHKNDDIRELIKKFATSLKDKIRVNNRQCAFDSKVLMCFNNLLQTLEIES